MKFLYWGDVLDGYEHAYNHTTHNERSVELAVLFHWALPYVLAYGCLEVGNVTSHYGFSGQRVVDKYELADDVENLDVLDIGGTYDRIISISTIEHVGWDETPREPTAALEALWHLESLLAPGGRMLVTVPGGYHPDLDSYLAAETHSTRSCTLVRRGDTWVQTDELTFLPYGLTTPWAESVWIGEWEASDGHSR